ncbi:hypothetical protein GXM_03789 [Nostoc sphaeroides CCNUC1]|uniref:Uncharacterized protein n=1 Tax=Nostoc sphaeroides CCNUC1 TaxID=2653204 RepID=A0A5P8W0R8_9NOSO|nr:hypothetical protein GXM_03789 [Nostoc sphaeroides CCNUC1]
MATTLNSPVCHSILDLGLRLRSVERFWILDLPHALRQRHSTSDFGLCI